MDIVKAFNSNDLHTDIVIKGTVNDPLFRASDVGVVLDIASIRSVLRDFDESEKVVHSMHTLGGTQEVTFLTEKGLYKVLFRSRKPIAQKFQNWVCEVIKEIRLKGIYKMQSEIKKVIEEKNEAIEEKNRIREKTIIDNFPSNVQCVYYGTIDNKSEKGERLIKFGNSNSLKNRIYCHKKTYNNFRLINAFRVENKLQIENAIKEHPLFIERQRTIMIKKHNFTELINMEGICDSVLDETIRDIIRRIEYSPEKYLILLEENKELKKMIGDNTPDYTLSLKREIKKLKEGYETQIASIRQGYESQIINIKEGYESMNESYLNQIKELQDKLTKLCEKAIEKPTNINFKNTNDQSVNNNMMYNNLQAVNLDPDHLYKVLDKAITLADIYGGQQALAKVIKREILTNENGEPLAVCSDRARQMIKYKNMDNQIIKDPKAYNLISQIQPIANKIALKRKTEFEAVHYHSNEETKEREEEYEYSLTEQESSEDEFESVIERYHKRKYFEKDIIEDGE